MTPYFCNAAFLWFIRAPFDSRGTSDLSARIQRSANEPQFHGHLAAQTGSDGLADSVSSATQNTKLFFLVP